MYALLFFFFASQGSLALVPVGMWQIIIIIIIIIIIFDSLSGSSYWYFYFDS